MSEKPKSLVELFMPGPDSPLVEPSWPSDYWWEGVAEVLGTVYVPDKGKVQ